MVSIDWTPWYVPSAKLPSLFLSARNQTYLLEPMMSEVIIYFFIFGCKYDLFGIGKGVGMQDDIPYKIWN